MKVLKDTFCRLNIIIIIIYYLALIILMMMMIMSCTMLATKSSSAYPKLLAITVHSLMYEN